METRMKKIIAVMISIMLVFALASCNLAAKLELASRDSDPPLYRDDDALPTEAPQGNQGETVPGLPAIPGIPNPLDMLSGEWPENEFTAQIPKPSMKVLHSESAEDEFSVAFLNVSAEDIKAYAAELKAAGFTVDPEEEDKEIYGVTMYSYRASNPAGYCVELTFAAGTGALNVSK